MHLTVSVRGTMATSESRTDLSIKTEAPPSDVVVLGVNISSLYAKVSVSRWVRNFGLVLSVAEDGEQGSERLT